MRWIAVIWCGMVISLLLVNCSKGGIAESDPDHVLDLSDTTYPVVEINTPVSNQVFANGSVISITGKITDNAGLFRGSISVTNDANGDVLKSQEYEIHGLQAYNYNLSYTATVTKASNYTVTVEFEDHGLNVTKQDVKIKINP